MMQLGTSGEEAATSLPDRTQSRAVTLPLKNSENNSSNDLLANESRKPAIPLSNLVVPSIATTKTEQSQIGMESVVAVPRNSKSLAAQIKVTLDYDECVLPSLIESEYYLRKEEGDLRFRLSSASSSTRAHVCFNVRPDDHLARYLEDQALTDEAIEWQLTWNRKMRRLADSTLSRQEQLLKRFFRNPCIPDPVLGLRAPTAREVLQPDFGRIIVIYARDGLADFGDGVVIDFLTALRRFCRFICTNGAALPSGVNLRAVWGTLVCPIGDRDIPKRKPQSTVFLPSLATMQSIFEAIQEWASRQRKQVTAWRTAAITILCFESGMRGVEARRGSLSEQLFDRHRGIEALTNPLCIHGAKGGPDREVQINPFGWDMLRYWCQEWRPNLAGDDLTGPFFPSSTGSQKGLSSSSLTETTKPLFDALKERGLLHESFSFHATRKTYTTHFLEQHGMDVDFLLTQCGWSSSAQLPVYVLPSMESVAAQREQFGRTVGTRRRSA